MNLVDISIPLRQQIPFWPNNETFYVKIYFNCPANSMLHTDNHFGTHVDAQRYFIRDPKNHRSNAS